MPIPGGAMVVRKNFIAGPGLHPQPVTEVSAYAVSDQKG